VKRYTTEGVSNQRARLAQNGKRLNGQAIQAFCF
jgi:hypothetical protein